MWVAVTYSSRYLKNGLLGCMLIMPGSRYLNNGLLELKPKILNPVRNLLFKQLESYRGSLQGSFKPRYGNGQPRSD